MQCLRAFFLLDTDALRFSDMDRQSSVADGSTAAWVRRVLADSRRTDRWIVAAQLGITLASLGLGTYGEHGHDVHTLGGLVMAELGRRPLQGDEVSFGAVTMRVEAVEGLAVRRVSIHLPADVGPAMDGA